MAKTNLQLPETGFLRLSQIIGNPNANPPIPALIPISRSTWWAGVSSGRFPRSIKLGPRITAWRIEDIRKLIQQTGGEDVNNEINGPADGNQATKKISDTRRSNYRG